MKKRTNIAVVAAAVSSLLAQAALAEDTVTIKGSDTMVILGQRWAEAYMKSRPDVRIQVTGGGSGTGIAALINGTTDVAQASRPMKDAEKRSAEARRGAKVTEIPVALDAVSIYVHESNPIDALSLAQARKIYTGVITSWKEVGGNDAPITLYSRENNSGTYVFFKEHVLEDDDFDPSAQTLPGTASVVNAVAMDENGIGYGGIAYAAGIKPLAIEKDDASPAVAGTLENVQSGQYPLARQLYFYLFSGKNAAADAFAAWASSGDGQKLVADVGYYPLDK